MKKNTFKNRIVQNEDGTRSYKKQPLWMHSLEKPNTTAPDWKDAVFSVVFICILVVGLYLISKHLA